MTIKIANEDALIIKVADLISSSTVDYGRYVSLSRSVVIDEDSSFPRDSAEKIYRFFGEQGVVTYIRSEINNILQVRNEFTAKELSKSLRDFPEFTDPISAARGIISKLKTLPIRYRATVALPLEFSEPLLSHISAIRLGENAAICRAEKLPSNFSLNHPIENIDSSLFSDPFSDTMNTDRNLSLRSLYFSTVELGFANSNYSSSISNELFDKIRAMYGALHALRVLSPDFRHTKEKKPFALVHEEDAARVLVATDELDNDLWERRYNRSTDKYVNSLNDAPSSLRMIFEKIAILFSGDDFSRRLSAASIWYFRAINSSNALDSLLHATISIEVLLGDRETAESVGLTKLLANRCAYLIGNTRASRQRISDDFMSVYRVRSAIVHGGKRHLDREDRKVIASCLDICAGVIAKELELHHSIDLGKK